MPSSIRQLASPTLVNPSRLLPSNSETHPPSLEACGEYAMTAKPTASTAIVERRFMKLLPIDVVFGTGSEGTIAGDKSVGKLAIRHSLKFVRSIRCERSVV